MEFKAFDGVLKSFFVLGVVVFSNAAVAKAPAACRADVPRSVYLQCLDDHASCEIHGDDGDGEIATLGSVVDNKVIADAGDGTLGILATIKGTDLIGDDGDGELATLATFRGNNIFADLGDGTTGLYGTVKGSAIYGDDGDGSWLALGTATGCTVTEAQAGAYVLILKKKHELLGGLFGF